MEPINNQIQVDIDLKPGSYPNSINLKSQGNVAVAVLTTDDLDAYNVDPDTVIFAGANLLRWTMEDVDADGDFGLLFHLKTQELEVTKEDTTATMEGETYDGIEIIGTDLVNVVPKDKAHIE